MPDRLARQAIAAIQAIEEVLQNWSGARRVGEIDSYVRI
jgi:hypothetical protein